MILLNSKIDNIDIINIDNEKGLVLTLCTIGASIYDLKVIDKDNKLESVVVRPNDFQVFCNSTGYYGKSIGRFAGRIDKGKCFIDEKEYNIAINWNGVNALHGGPDDAISHKVFDYSINKENEYIDVIFTYKELENYLPGDIDYKITYRVYDSKNVFNIYFEAIPNKKTIINLTNHAYFNLSGDGKNTVLDHNMMLYCDKYTRLNNELITISVDEVNEVMDFTKGKKIKTHIEDSSLQNHTAFGYDHCFIKANEKEDIIAVLSDDVSKRKLTVKSSLPTVVCYSNNYVDSQLKFNVLNEKLLKYHAITLECQHIPNGINMENVEKSLFEANEKYSHYVSYIFEIML